MLRVVGRSLGAAAEKAVPYLRLWGKSAPTLLLEVTA